MLIELWSTNFPIGLNGLKWIFYPISTTFDTFNLHPSFCWIWFVVFLFVEYWILESSLVFWGGLGSFGLRVILEFTVGFWVLTKLILCFKGETEGVLSSYLILVGVKPPCLSKYGTYVLCCWVLMTGICKGLCYVIVSILT